MNKDNLIKKYTNYVENLRWNIRENDIQGERLNNANIQIQAYNEIINDLSESPQPSAPCVSTDNQDFLKYTTEARDKFCRYIKSLDWNTEMRTSVDDLLICFEQLKERYAQAQQGNGWEEALLQIMSLCDNENPTHEAIWHIANDAISPKQ